MRVLCMSSMGQLGPSAPSKDWSPDGGGAGQGDAIKAELVCRLILAGVCTCSPLEEGILHSWKGWLVVHPLGWGVKGVGSKKTQKVRSPLG